MDLYSNIRINKQISTNLIINSFKTRKIRKNRTVQTLVLYCDSRYASLYGYLPHPGK